MLFSLVKISILRNGEIKMKAQVALNQPRTQGLPSRYFQNDGRSTSFPGPSRTPQNGRSSSDDPGKH
ncbi:hypothetical protein AC249_AIPGENE21591 [Exaiptasia diaphana]|nr:hypothetical protein AC249_AIPGENE21591 [Exaiptasia diaphana]